MTTIGSRLMSGLLGGSWRVNASSTVLETSKRCGEVEKVRTELGMATAHIRIVRDQQEFIEPIRDQNVLALLSSSISAATKHHLRSRDV